MRLVLNMFCLRCLPWRLTWKLYIWYLLQRKRRSVERKKGKGKGGKGGKGKGKGGGGDGSSDAVKIGKILNDVCEDVDDIDEDVSIIYCEVINVQYVYDVYVRSTCKCFQDYLISRLNSQL